MTDGHAKMLAAAAARRRPMPEDFRDLAPTMPMAVARAHWNTGYAACQRWHEEAGTEPLAAPRVVDLPPDWFAPVAHMPARTLSERYNITRHQVTVWRRVLGVEVPRYKPAKSVAIVPGTGSVKRGPRRTTASNHRSAPPLLRDITAAGVAADDLRRAGYVPVCRASTRDRRADPDLWIVGRRTLSTDEMMTLAAERTRRAAAA